MLERAAAGVPVDGRLLQGVLVQVLVAVTVAAALAWAGRVAEVAGRALRRRFVRRPEGHPARPQATSWVRPAQLLAAGLGGRAPPLG